MSLSSPYLWSPVFAIASIAVRLLPKAPFLRSRTSRFIPAVILLVEASSIEPSMAITASLGWCAHLCRALLNRAVDRQPLLAPAPIAGCFLDCWPMADPRCRGLNIYLTGGRPLPLGGACHCVPFDFYRLCPRRCGRFIPTDLFRALGAVRCRPRPGEWPACEFLGDDADPPPRPLHLVTIEDVRVHRPDRNPAPVQSGASTAQGLTAGRNRVLWSHRMAPRPSAPPPRCVPGPHDHGSGVWISTWPIGMIQGWRYGCALYAIPSSVLLRRSG